MTLKDFLERRHGLAGRDTDDDDPEIFTLRRSGVKTSNRLFWVSLILLVLGIVYWFFS